MPAISNVTSCIMLFQQHQLLKHTTSPFHSVFHSVDAGLEAGSNETQLTWSAAGQRRRRLLPAMWAEGAGQSEKRSRGNPESHHEPATGEPATLHICTGSPRQKTSTDPWRCFCLALALRPWVRAASSCWSVPERGPWCWSCCLKSDTLAERAALFSPVRWRRPATSHQVRCRKAQSQSRTDLVSHKTEV